MVVKKRSNSDKKVLRELCLTQKLTGGKLYGVMLPLILDSSHKPFKQPILIRFNENLLEKYGFSLPFKDYLKEKENFFEMKFQGISFTVQLIAMGGKNHS